MNTVLRWRNSLFQAIEDAALLRRPRRISIPGGTTALAGHINIQGREVEIAIDVDPLQHHSLPIFVLRPWDALGFIPHIDPKGTICFLEHEGILFDWRRPLDVVRECLAHVQRTLHQGVTGINQGDFVDEFEVYWQRLPNLIIALSNLELFEHAAEVLVASSAHAQPALRFAHDASSLRQIPHSSTDYGPWSASRAIYLPLASGTMLIPPRSDGPFWSARDVRQLLMYCTAENRERVEAFIHGRIHQQEYLVVGLPRPAGGMALFGIRFDGIRSQHPLTDSGDAEELKPITLIRRDKDYLVQRGGGYTELANRRVLLIGCGAVGGHLAFELSRAGVEQLTLVDPDKLSPQNTYRHVLGRNYWHTPKALALKQALRSQLPFSRSQAVMETIEQAIAKRDIHLESYDLIVSAIGNPTSELALNEHVRCAASGPPIIFTWLDPYGIGGHAVLTGMSGYSGCFECLYTATDMAEPLHNRAAFAASAQVFHRSLAGCDSLHTPYGSLDAVQTAQLAARLALDVLIGREQKNRLRSWKGNAESFTAEGFTLSSRYHLSTDEREGQETLFAQAACRICGATRNETGP